MANILTLKQMHIAANWMESKAKEFHGIGYGKAASILSDYLGCKVTPCNAKTIANMAGVDLPGMTTSRPRTQNQEERISLIEDRIYNLELAVAFLKQTPSELFTHPYPWEVQDVEYTVYGNRNSIDDRKNG